MSTTRGAPMIRTRGLTRHFRVKDETVEAVRGIDLDVEAGELVAFLGPNGAGKSTTLRMLTTLLRPTAGTAEVVGFDVVADPGAVRGRIGAIGQGNGAGHAQRARDELVNQGRCYGQGRREAAGRADELLASLGLERLAGRIVNTLSGGQRRRLDIAMGMVHRPSLLFLDEPSTGLDPHNRANLKEHIERLRVEHGTTIVLTTHYLDEADALADRVVIGASDRDGALSVARALGRLADPQGLAMNGTTVTARVNGGAEVLPALLFSLGHQGVGIASAEVARANLDDVFLALTGRSLRETAVAAEPTTPILEEQAA